MFIVSRLKIEGALIKQAQEGVDPVEKNAAENLKNLLLVYCQVLIFFKEAMVVQRVVTMLT